MKNNVTVLPDVVGAAALVFILIINPTKDRADFGFLG